MASIPSLVTTQWLNDQMESPEWTTKFRLLDGTWDLTRAKRNFVEEHKSCRILGAKHFSLLECKNKESSLSNTVPNLAYFEEYVSNLGIRNDHHIIVYDNSEAYGLFSAPRVWWLFNLFGHDNVSVVDGGLPRWKKDGFNTVSGDYSEAEKWEASSSKFKATFKPELIKDMSFMKANLDSETPVQVIDARSSGRFRGVDPEPNPKIRSGHIPNSISVPHNTNNNPENRTMLKADDIQRNLRDHKVDIDNPVVATCGSGISACCLALAIHVATGRRIAVFDDSWFGWYTNTPDELQVREE